MSRTTFIEEIRMKGVKFIDLKPFTCYRILDEPFGFKNTVWLRSKRRNTKTVAPAFVLSHIISEKEPAVIRFYSNFDPPERSTEDWGGFVVCFVV